MSKKVKIILAILAVLVVAIPSVLFCNMIRSNNHIYKDFIRFSKSYNSEFVYTKSDIDKLETSDTILLFVSDIENIDGHFYGYLKDKAGKLTDSRIRLCYPIISQWGRFHSDEMLVCGSFVKSKWDNIGNGKELISYFQVKSFATLSDGKIDKMYQAESLDDETSAVKVGDVISVMVSGKDFLIQDEYKGKERPVYDGMNYYSEFDNGEFIYKTDLCDYKVVCDMDEFERFFNKLDHIQGSIHNLASVVVNAEVECVRNGIITVKESEYSNIPTEISYYTLEDDSYNVDMDSILGGNIDDLEMVMGRSVENLLDEIKTEREASDLSSKEFIEHEEIIPKDKEEDAVEAFEEPVSENETEDYDDEYHVIDVSFYYGIDLYCNITTEDGIGRLGGELGTLDDNGNFCTLSDIMFYDADESLYGSTIRLDKIGVYGDPYIYGGNVFVDLIEYTVGE